MFKLLKILSFLLLPTVAQAAVNVVVIAPQEGEYAQYGREFAEGVKIAANDINSKGGVLGQKINLIVADDRCEDVYAISMAQMLGVKAEEEDKISLVIGPFCRNEFSEVASIYEKSGIVQIAPLPVESDEQNLWHIAGLKSAQAKAFFEYYQNNLSGQNVAIVYDSENRGAVDVASELQKEFMEANISSKLTSYSLITYGKNYDLLAKEVLLNNKIVFMAANDEDVYQLRRMIKRKKADALIFANRYVAKDFEVEGEGQYYLGLKAFKDSPYFTETLVDLRLQGAEPNGLGVYGFAALNAWVEVTTKAKSFAMEKLQNVVKTSKIAMPWGDFEAKQDDLPLLYGVFEKRGDEYTQVE